MRLETLAVNFRNNRAGALVDQTDRLFSPRAGLIYNLSGNVSVYSSYSTSFIPRAGEQLASLNLANRSLAAEKFTNLEFGVKSEFKPDVAFTAAAYRLDRRNVAISGPADTTKSLLVDGQRSTGLEVGLTGGLTRNWSVVGGFAYQDGTIRTT